jgi:large subunit ribosomal protein L9
MKVVLRKDVPTLGKAGELKEVADGYGANYLIPRGLASPASKTAVRNVEAKQAASARRQTRETEEHRELADRIGATSVTVKARTGEQGRLYGSVTSADIAEALAKALGNSELDKRTIDLDEPIRHLGEYKVKVHVAPQLTATLTVVVEADA